MNRTSEDCGEAAPACFTRTPRSYDFETGQSAQEMSKKSTTGFVTGTICS
jgi:hypothetical protein